MLKRLLKSAFMQNVASFLITQYLRFVSATSRVVLEPQDLYERIDGNWPAIIAIWHGQHFMVALIRKPHQKFKVLISRHRDGEINAKVAENFGIGLIRGSGTKDKRVMEKRGALAFRDMVHALEDGWSMTLTADVPKIARKAGLGIITLAKKSGRPIYPLAIANSRRHVFENSWDKTALPLPFGRMAVVIAEPMLIDKNADDAALESARAALETTLEQITLRAYALADGEPKGQSG